MLNVKKHADNLFYKEKYEPYLTFKLEEANLNAQERTNTRCLNDGKEKNGGIFPEKEFHAYRAHDHSSHHHSAGGDARSAPPPGTRKGAVHRMRQQSETDFPGISAIHQRLSECALQKHPRTRTAHVVPPPVRLRRRTRRRSRMLRVPVGGASVHVEFSKNLALPFHGTAH